jgi:hypothetical protein
MLFMMMIGLIIPYICFSTCNCLCDSIVVNLCHYCDMISVKIDNYIIFNIHYLRFFMGWSIQPKSLSQGCVLYFNFIQVYSIISLVPVSTKSVYRVEVRKRSVLEMNGRCSLIYFIKLTWIIFILHIGDAF